MSTVISRTSRSRKNCFDAHSSNKTDRMHKRVEWSDLVYQVERLEGRMVGKILPLLLGREKLLRKREGLATKWERKERRWLRIIFLFGQAYNTETKKLLCL